MSGTGQQQQQQQHGDQEHASTHQKRVYAAANQKNQTTKRRRTDAAQVCNPPLNDKVTVTLMHSRSILSWSCITRWARPGHGTCHVAGPRHERARSGRLASYRATQHHLCHLPCAAAGTPAEKSGHVGRCPLELAQPAARLTMPPPCVLSAGRPLRPANPDGPAAEAWAAAGADAGAARRTPHQPPPGPGEWPVPVAAAERVGVQVNGAPCNRVLHARPRTIAIARVGVYVGAESAASGSLP
jgi:hypothetical protein